MAKQFTLNSAEAYSERFTTSKQGGDLIRVNIFTKNSFLDV